MRLDINEDVGTILKALIDTSKQSETVYLKWLHKERESFKLYEVNPHNPEHSKAWEHDNENMNNASHAHRSILQAVAGYQQYVSCAEFVEDK